MRGYTLYAATATLLTGCGSYVALPGVRGDGGEVDAGVPGSCAPGPEDPPWAVWAVCDGGCVDLVLPDNCGGCGVVCLSSVCTTVGAASSCWVDDGGAAP